MRNVEEELGQATIHAAGIHINSLRYYVLNPTTQIAAVLRVNHPAHTHPLRASAKAKRDGSKDARKHKDTHFQLYTQKK